MVVLDRMRPVPLWVGVALAVLLGGLVAPEKVQAGCSHYVVSQFDRFDPMTPSHLDLPVPPIGPTAPADLPSPCAGLSCSRDPLAPPVPSPAPIRVVEWGCLATVPNAQHPEPFSLVADSGQVRPIQHGLSIDRPPRSI